MLKHSLRLAVLGGIAAAALAPAAQAAPKAVPCTKQATKHYCSFYVAGNGISGGAPVLDSTGRRVGYLNQGSNWVICQQSGISSSSGAYHNVWWAWTEANDRKWGWVNALWASGGDNNGKFGGTPNCRGTHGKPPHAAPPPKKAPPKPKGPSLRQRADKILNLHYEAFIKYKHDHHPAPFVWSSDGCSNTPSGLADLFNKECQLHDFGYRNYGAGKLHLGVNEATRAKIDHRFLDEMTRRCNKFTGLKSGNGVVCRGQARAMYDIVRNFGRPSFY